MLSGRIVLLQGVQLCLCWLGRIELRSTRCNQFCVLRRGGRWSKWLSNNWYSFCPNPFSINCYIVLFENGFEQLLCVCPDDCSKDCLSSDFDSVNRTNFEQIWDFEQTLNICLKICSKFCSRSKFDRSFVRSFVRTRILFEILIHDRSKISDNSSSHH